MSLAHSDPTSAERDASQEDLLLDSMACLRDTSERDPGIDLLKSGDGEVSLMNRTKQVAVNNSII